MGLIWFMSIVNVVFNWFNYVVVNKIKLVFDNMMDDAFGMDRGKCNENKYRKDLHNNDLIMEQIFDSDLKWVMEHFLILFQR